MTSHTTDLSGNVLSFGFTSGSMQLSRVLSNLSHFCQQTATTDAVAFANLWHIKNDPTHSLSNMCIENTTDAYEELRKLAAGSIVLDVTAVSQGRNIALLHSLAARARQNGVSLLFSHSIAPTQIAIANLVEYQGQLLKKLREEVLVGCPVTSEASSDSLRAAQVYTKASAVVCDFGMPFMPPKLSLSDAEISVLRVCGTLHSELRQDKEYGSKLPPVIISLPPFSTVHRQVLTILRESCADLSKVVFNQVSLSQCDSVYWLNLLNTHPCSICIDTWGYSATFNTTGTRAFASDSELVDQVMNLTHHGLSSRIILSLAVYCKIQLGAYGGYGYAYLQNVVTPMLHDRLVCSAATSRTDSTERGIDATAIVHALAGGNLWSLVNWRPPPPAVVLSVEYLSCHICAQKFVPGNHFSKFGFEYCTTKCLGVHRGRDWK